jgi:hypothetical protein
LCLKGSHRAYGKSILQKTRSEKRGRKRQSKINSVAMLRTHLVLTLVAVACLSTLSHASNDNSYKLALVDHPGQLSWSAEGFTIIESSAKPGGNEIGARGQSQSGQQTFLGFLFLFPEKAPLTSAKFLDGVIGLAKNSNASL